MRILLISLTVRRMKVVQPPNTSYFSVNVYLLRISLCLSVIYNFELYSRHRTCMHSLTLFSPLLFSSLRLNLASLHFPCIYLNVGFLLNSMYIVTKNTMNTVHLCTTSKKWSPNLIGKNSGQMVNLVSSLLVLHYLYLLMRKRQD